MNKIIFRDDLLYEVGLVDVSSEAVVESVLIEQQWNEIAMIGHNNKNSFVLLNEIKNYFALYRIDQNQVRNKTRPFPNT